MENSKKCWITRLAQALGILVIVVPLFTSTVRTIDLTNETAQTVEAMGVKLDHEVEARKTEDAIIRDEIRNMDKSTQSELAEMRTEQAVMANDIKYIIKILDGGTK